MDPSEQAPLTEEDRARIRAEETLRHAVQQELAARDAGATAEARRTRNARLFLLFVILAIGGVAVYVGVGADQRFGEDFAKSSCREFAEGIVKETKGSGAVSDRVLPEATLTRKDANTIQTRLTIEISDSRRTLPMPFTCLTTKEGGNWVTRVAQD